MKVQINKTILAVVFFWGISLSALTQAGTYSGGAGTQDQSYQISTVNDWMELIGSSSDWKKHFNLTATIDFEGATITPVAPDANRSSGGFQGTAFTGVFDGEGYVLRNFVIDKPYSDYVGLFGQVGSGGQVRNLGVEPLQVTGRNYVGGLCGVNYEGTITSCYATGAVSGTYYLGGLCGVNDDGTITSCYATGIVSGTQLVGGLCGDNYEGTISDSFWDNETSGMTTSSGGTGKTTADMQTLLTFTDAGWDFVGETINGTEDIWRMCLDGIEYPKLSWEFSTIGDFTCPDGVNMEDLLYMASVWLTTGSSLADTNFDQKVNYEDMAVLSANWLKQRTLVIHKYFFDNSPNWTTEGQWEFGQPLGLGGDSYGNPDPNSGFTGMHVYGINLSGDYNTEVSGPYYLTTGPISCRHFSDVKVSFMSWLNIDGSNYAQCSFEVSDNGTDWVTLWSNTPEPITDNDWNKMEFDISDYADDNSTLYLRWGYQIIDRAYPYSGWNIDDVEIWGTL